MLKEIRKNYKRLVAFLLSITMIIMNMGGNAITAFAGEEREISLFMAEGEKILEAAAHLQDQEEFTKEDLEEMGLDAPQKGAVKKFEKLFLPEEGKVYELDLEIDNELAAEGTDLRVFYCTGTEEIIFLFLNESSQAVDCCVNIDGYETKLVTVGSNSNAADVAEMKERIEEANEESGENESAGASSGSHSGGASGGTLSGGFSGDSSSGSSDETLTEISGGSADETEDKAADKEDSASEGVTNDNASDEKADNTEKESVSESSNEERKAEENPDTQEEEKPADEDKSAEDSKDSTGNDTEESDTAEKDTSNKEDNNAEKEDKPVVEDNSASQDKNSDKGAAEKADSTSESSNKDKDDKQEAEKNSDKDSSDSSSSKNEDAKSGSNSSKDGSSSDNSSGEKSSNNSSSNEKSSGDSSSSGGSSGSDDSSSKDSKSGDSDQEKNLSISYHKTAIAAVALDVLQGADDVEEAEETEAETESEKETEAETIAEAETLKETKAIVSEENLTSETATAVEKDKAEEGQEETTAADDKTESTETAEEIKEEEETQEGTDAEEIKQDQPEETSPDISENRGEETEITIDAANVEETQEEIEEDIYTEAADNHEEAEEADDRDTVESDDIGDDWEIPGKAYDTVTIQNSMMARAYCVDLEDVKKAVELGQGLEEEQIEFHVDYQVNLDEAAEVTGDEYVTEGETLYFAVEPKDGFAIAAVLANGEWISAIEDLDDFVRTSAPEWRGYSSVYRVEDVTEDLEVIIDLEELESIIPSKIYTAESADAIFSVSVPDDAFEEEVELRVAKIVDEQYLEELSDQANSVLKAEKAIAGIMAWDVTFVSLKTGNEIEPSKAVEVNIRLKKSAVPEKEADVTGISVVHLPENDKAEVVAATDNAKEKEFEFQTDGFSIYVIAAEKAASVELDGKSYSTITEAINSITDQENETIVLLENISENVVSNGKNYTLNLNGKKLTSKAVGKSAYTINGGKVTIQDGTITGTKKSGSVNISGIRSANADVVLKNCVIEKNTGYSYGGGIYAEGGSFTLEDCIVTENKATYGAGIYGLNCALEIKGKSKVNGNTGGNSYSAGGVYIKGGSFITGNGQEGSAERTVEISNNNPTSTTTNGVYLLDCSAEVKDAKISANGFYGVEIKNTKAGNSIAFNNVEFSNHSVNSALYVNSLGDFTATNCDFINNAFASTKKISAALCLGDVNASKTGSGGNKTLSNCRFLNNTAKTSVTSGAFPSGALAIKEKNQTEIEGCEFTGNSGKVGALYTTSATVTITGKTVFSSNEGTLSGAIQAASGTVTVSGAVVKNNVVISTAKGAGGINVAGGTFKMNRSLGDVAVYNNLYNDKPRDLYLNTGFSTIEILPAQEMRDPDSELKWGAWNDGNQDAIEKLTASKPSSKTGFWKAVEKVKSEFTQIGEVKYETLSQAIEAAKAGEVITLIEEAVPVSETIAINKNVVIDMNNCRIEPKDGMPNSAPLISIQSGGTLTLSGNGVIGNWIEIADEKDSGKTEGSLYLEGNIRVESLSMNEVPIESYGTIVVKKDIDNLLINTYKGKVEVDEGVNVGKLDILETIGFKKIYPKNVVINGSVEKLILSQKRTQKKDTAEATLNGRIGTLTLKHEGCSYGMPVTYAGENFGAETIQLTPSLGNSNPSYDVLIDPKKEADDIIMILGSEGYPIQLDKVNNLENVVWKKPADATANDNFLRFLVRPAIDENGNLVLRKSVSNGIYLDGEKGSDEGNSGLAADDAVKSFNKAKELLKEAEYDTIYVTGAVTVSSFDSEWTFGDLDGNEDNNKHYKLQRYLKYFGALVKVPSGTELTLKDIIIDGGGSELNTRDTSVTDPLIMNDGKLTITSGSVLRNNHNVYQDVFHEGGAVRNAGTLIMNDGTIEANSAVSGGGVFNRGTFAFSGGKIINNAGKGMHKSSGTLDKNGNYKKEIFNAGGGVFIANSGKMTMSGSAEISGNTAKIGGGISLGNNHNVYIGGTLTMKGGTIVANEAEKEGGGIFIQENCKAKVTKGDIVNNISHGGAFGGGGVYVNGGTGLGNKNGLLELENVRISKNVSAGKGGGIAACPSANVKIYLNDGGLIKYNTGKSKDFDIYSTNIGYNKYSSKGIYLSRYMMGGASYDWTDVPDEARNEFCVYSASEKVSAKDEKLLVNITGNTADTNGGGIGTNGDVIIGKDTAVLMEVSVSKEWKYDKDGEFVSGIENLKPINTAIGSVTFQLQEKKKKDGDDQWKDVVYGGKANSVPNGEKWSTITFINLRKVDSDGDEVEYRVVELTDDGFILVDTKHETDASTGNNSWTFTNMPVYSLKIAKAVEDNYHKYSQDKKFEFEITLKNADEVHTPLNGIVSAEKGFPDAENGEIKAESVELEFKDGKAVVLLGEDEYIHLKDLSAGMLYSVAEKEDDEYVTQTNGEVKNTAEGTIQIGVNTVNYTNIAKEPHGELKITKLVEDGDLAKDWNFIIEFRDAENKPLNTIGKLYPFTYYNGTEDLEGTTTNERIPSSGEVHIKLDRKSVV